MFANDWDAKGTTGSFAFSIIVHLLVLMLIMYMNFRQKRALADYTLTEINMMETVPDEAPKPVEIQKPKSMMDMFKQIIPLKQNAPQVSLAKPQALLEKPKLELNKMQALSLDKSNAPKLDSSLKKIDLSNEIGMKKLSPAEMKAVELSQKQDRSLATAPQSKLSLNQKPSMSSFLPSARPGISTMKSSQPVLKPETVKTEKPVATAVPVKEKIEIKQNSALLITGQIANRRVLRAAKPPYPRWAQEQGIQAEVFIFITVRTDGTVKDNAYVQTSSGYPELDQLAMDAVQQFQFASTAGSGDETGTVVFRFQLQR